MLALLLAGCGDSAASTVDDDGATGGDPTPTATAAASDPATVGDAPDTGDTPSEASEPAAATATVTDLAGVAVTPEALPAPEEGFTWAETRSATGDRPTVRLFDPCDPTDYPTDAERLEVHVADLRVEDAGGEAPETATVRQNVVRYQSADVADEAFARFVQVAEACATSEGQPGTRLTTEVLDAAEEHLLLQTTPEIGLTTAYTVVARRGDVVTVASFIPGEVRDADAEGREVADAVTAALAEAG